MKGVGEEGCANQPLEIIPHSDQSIAEFLATPKLRADVANDIQAFGKLDGQGKTRGHLVAGAVISCNTQGLRLTDEAPLHFCGVLWPMDRLCTQESCKAGRTSASHKT